MGIVIGSCMAKETSASLNSPVTILPPGGFLASNVVAPDVEQQGHPARVLALSPASGGHGVEQQRQQQRMSRAVSGPVPYAFMHGNAIGYQMRGHHMRRVIHGE